jgi:uncharacterized membrane protein
VIRGLALALLVAGCGEEDPTGGGDSGLPDPACDDAPAATWDSFGRGFLTQHCDVCHAATSPDRHDAPADVSFDTEDDVRTWRDEILVRATGDAPTMPPTGGVSEDDRFLLESWLTCGL